MRGRLSDSSWKSGPTYPEPTASEHAISPEPAGYDHDGVGRDEAERVDGEALCAVREAYSCSRDGCDADPRRNHVYALTDVSQRVQQAAAYAIDSRGSGTARNRASLAEGNEADYTEEPTAEDSSDSQSESAVSDSSPTSQELIEYLAINATIVDYDEGPILGFEFGDDTFGYVSPHFTDESGFGGPCYGHVEPEPDINAHRYDL